MLYPIRFTKASGAGNDFVITSAFDEKLPPDRSRLAKDVCDRHFGVGADGLLILEPSPTTAFRMSYFNADGSYGGMCGNGGRCVARFAYLRGRAQDRMRFEALDHTYEAHVKGERVSLRMKDPSPLRPVAGLQAAGHTFEGLSVDTGAPHFVVFWDELDALDVETTGRILRNHISFRPSGTNVNFVKVTGADAISIRTYERGVERETLACGTGSIASALASIERYGVSSPVRIAVKSGEELCVRVTREGGGFRDVFLEGTAHMLFSGMLVYDDESGAIRLPLENATRSEGPR